MPSATRKIIYYVTKFPALLVERKYFPTDIFTFNAISHISQAVCSLNLIIFASLSLRPFRITLEIQILFGYLWHNSIWHIVLCLSQLMPEGLILISDMQRQSTKFGIKSVSESLIAVPVQNSYSALLFSPQCASLERCICILSTMR